MIYDIEDLTKLQRIANKLSATIGVYNLLLMQTVIDPTLPNKEEQLLEYQQKILVACKKISTAFSEVNK